MQPFDQRAGYVRTARRILVGTTPLAHYDAEDVVHDSLIAAHLRTGRWSVEPGDLPMSYHMVTARGRELRRSRVDLSRVADPTEALDGLVAEDATTAVDEADERRQVLAALGRAIEELPPAQRRAVAQRLAGGSAGGPAQRMAHTAAIRNLRRQLKLLGLATGSQLGEEDI